MLTCKELTALVTEYLEGRMSLEERLEFQKHAGLCRDCRNYLDQMKVTVEMLGEVPADPIPDDMMAELLAHFDSWKK